ncbi:MAG TPA: FtsX-like permease family protein [Verrucomicrobiae bacterium]|nr:FtsX-like permease family protein [Verrucomicrobiae bacterium]
MTSQLAWGAAARIAWREMRASRARFLFVVLAVAVGVGSLTGVRGFSGSFRHMLLAQARTLMAADMTARVFALPDARQQAALDRLQARGVRRTWITETVTMASSAATPNPLLISVKAVDPQVYPFYGTVTLNPPQALRDALTASTVVVSDDLLVRLNVATGDTLRIGGQDFRIAGTVVSEPDRMTGSLNVGPRVMITREGLDRTGLIGVGSRASERYLFALPAGGKPDVSQVRRILKLAFPEATLADYRETHPIITRGLDRSTTFLSLIGLIALVIGAMGVASAMHGHLQQKLDSIAVMKCIGARSGQIIRIYTAQTLMLGLGGGVIGVAFGVAVAAVFPGFLAKYFQIDTAAYWNAWPAAQGIAVACLVTLLFTLPPLLSIRAIRPALVFRRDVEAAPRAGRRAAILTRAAILLGTGAVALTLTEGDWRDRTITAAYFTGGLAVAVGLLWLAGWLVLRGCRLALRYAGPRMPGTIRHGMANLYRPGNQAQSAVVALGVGVMFTLTVFLVQTALVEQIRGSAPPGMPNVFLLDIPANQRAAVSELIRRQPGVKEAPEVAFAVAARIAAVDGKALEDKPHVRRFLRTRSVTTVDAMPPDAMVLEGAWWKPGDRDPQVCVQEEAARILNLKPGATIDWSIWNRTIRTRVACIERTESIRMTGRFEFLFNPGPLDGLPAVYYGSARVRPADVAALQRVVYETFPTVTVVNVADVMQIIDDVVQRIAAVIRFISAFTILAGAVMVASSVAGTRFRRMREVVTLKTLGATRRRIAWVFSIEFLALGAVAGIMGTALASGFAALVLDRLLEIHFRPDALTNGLAVLVSAMTATAAGWLASFRVLGRKPLEILRDE